MTLEVRFIRENVLSRMHRRSHIISLHFIPGRLKEKPCMLEFGPFSLTIVQHAIMSILWSCAFLVAAADVQWKL